MALPDREEVTKGLEYTYQHYSVVKGQGFLIDKRNGDEYAWIDPELITDALALLKAQEPRVMKVGEVHNWVNSDRVTREPVAFEMRGGVCVWIIGDEVRGIPGEADLTSDIYGKTWRCWTSRPTDEQREATPWE